MRKSPRGRLSDHDCPRTRGSLEARCDIRRVAESDDLLIARTDRSHGGLAAVDPDTDAELLDAPGRGDVAAVLGDDIDDAKRGSRGALGIVLVRGRRPEVRRNPVAHVRLHHAAELLDHTRHPADTLADQLLHLVRREALAESGRADEIGKESGHRTKLVVEAAGGGKSRYPIRTAVPSDAALRAETGGRPEFRATFSTARAQLLEPRRLRRTLEPWRPFRCCRLCRLVERLDRLCRRVGRRPVDLEHGLAESHDVSGHERRHNLDASAVHERAIERVQVLDLEAGVARSDQRVAT